MVKITKANDGTLVEVEITFIDDVISVVLFPLKIIEVAPIEFYALCVVAMVALGYGIGGVVVGDKFGDFIPLLGGRRN
jgi:hypothetical protein